MKSRLIKSDFIRNLAICILCIVFIFFIWIWYEDIKIERQLPYLLTEEVKVDTVSLLYIQWSNNHYSVYPDGQHQKIELSTEKQEKINDLLYKLTNHTGEEIETLSNRFKKRNLDWKMGWNKGYENIPDHAVAPQIFNGFHYPSNRDFLKDMIKADEIIGGDSTCSLNDIQELVERKMNEENFTI